MRSTFFLLIAVIVLFLVPLHSFADYRFSLGFGVGGVFEPPDDMSDPSYLLDDGHRDVLTTAQFLFTQRFWAHGVDLSLLTQDITVTEEYISGPEDVIYVETALSASYVIELYFLLRFQAGIGAIIYTPMFGDEQEYFSYSEFMEADTSLYPATLLLTSLEIPFTVTRQFSISPFVRGVMFGRKETADPISFATTTMDKPLNELNKHFMIGLNAGIRFSIDFD